ncbi:site-specific integrase [Pseudomonas sp. V1]|uniref:gamma-mobile-trio recombinase GmtY n=1 Tax=Pseudomonas arcuscaelestis TaxID=2710591 RepID=UPI00193F1294|nr:gamma-mobile-trio recombinase GmtY [Pseudomonas arcuscaelestis]MBM3105885.1 site-specific integrase [Pseudomonas arcuscaelestis]
MDCIKVIAHIKRSNAGVLQEIPVLLTDQGVVRPLLDYCLEHAHARSASWMEFRIQAVQLLLRYCTANFDCFEDRQHMFRTFVQQLYSGTIGRDGVDPCGLYWRPRSTHSANRLIGALTDFSEWIADRYGVDQLNPHVTASRYDELLHWAAYQQRHARAFLAHTWDKATAKEHARQSRAIALRRESTAHVNGVKFFPDDCFVDLLFKGFVRPSQEHHPFIDGRLNLRDILIALLLHGGGLRVSEPLHLYVHDVGIDPVLKSPTGRDVALVRVFHPVDGSAPDDWEDLAAPGKRVNREAYLRGKYGMKPRNQYVSRSLRAGWKTRKLDDATGKYIQVQWFPAVFGEWFLDVWKLYLRQLREVPRAHPFAFVVMHGSDLGKPLSMDAYLASHQRAVRRIGLEPAKLNGTTAHGHRHAYGQRLVNAGVDVLVRRNALHHASLESQLPYTEPTAAKVSTVLASAMDRLENGDGQAALDVADLLAYGFDEVDPLGLLSGTNPKFRGAP